jgi:hypothetical protein
MKLRGLPSPNYGDALALSFAQPRSVGVVGPHYLSSRITALFEVLWWAPPTRQGKRALAALLDAFMLEGHARRVDWIICSRRVDQPATPTFRKRGFRTLELSHSWR